MSSDNLRPTGKQIRKALIDLDLSVLELAQAMGVSAYYIREIYAGRRKAVQLRKRIARYLAERYRAYKWPVPAWAKEKVA